MNVELAFPPDLRRHRQTVGPAEPVVVFETDEIEIIYVDRGSDDLLLTFSPLQMIAGDLRFFADGMASRAGLSALGIVNKDYGNYFPAAHMDAAMEVLQPILDSYAERIGFGHSMGAYGVLKYARLLNLDYTIGISPAYSINPADLPEQFRWFPQYYRDGIAGDRITPACASGRMWLIHDPLYAIDRTHAELTAGVLPLTLVRMPYTRHFAYRHFLRAGVFEAFLTLCRAGDARAIDTFVEQQRRAGAVRAHGIAIALADRHLPWAMAIYHRHGPEMQTAQFADMTFRLARAAIDQGHTAWALAALQNVLARDPTMDAARQLISEVLISGDLLSPERPVLPDRVYQELGLPDADLVRRFVSLTADCPLGRVQQAVGVPPQGVSFFVSAPLAQQVRAMRDRYEDLFDPAHIEMTEDNGTPYVWIKDYEFAYPADFGVAGLDHAAQHALACDSVATVIGDLLDALDDSNRILVLQQPEPLPADELIDLRITLARFPATVLMLIRDSQPAYPSGTVLALGDGLLVGYIDHATPDNDGAAWRDPDVTAWLLLLRTAHAVHVARLHARHTPHERARIDVVFGLTGLNIGEVGDGWSGPEDGFRWAIDDRSIMTIPGLNNADSYVLEMDVHPCIMPPEVPTQSLTIWVGGEIICTTSVAYRQKIRCAVPGRLVNGQAMIELAFDHPDAIAPQTDDRRLALAFYNLSLLAEERQG
jgi:hypothetical protein